MKCFVTGASGFLGGAVVRELLERDHRVTALIEPGAKALDFPGLKYDSVTGDIFDRRFLEQAMEGCDWCFHTAEMCRMWMRNYALMYRMNVEGTKNVIEAAGKVGCRRIVHTSTAGCIAPAKRKGGVYVPSVEIDRVFESEMAGDYLRSKFQAEAVAAKACLDQGLPVVVVNPSACVGAGDFSGTLHGRFVMDYFCNRRPVWRDRGTNWVSIRDVAAGHVLAAEKGRFGHRYILGSQEANWTFDQLNDVLKEVVGLRPQLPLFPRWLGARAAEVCGYAAFVTGREPRLTQAGFKLTRQNHWVDSCKAITELGFPQTSVKQAFIEAVKWFRFHSNFKK